MICSALQAQKQPRQRSAPRAPSDRAAAGNALHAASDSSLRAGADSLSGRMVVITLHFVAVTGFIFPTSPGEVRKCC